MPAEPAGPTDATGLEILTAAQCRTLLGGAQLGRIVFTDRALPAVQPVNYALAGDDVVIRVADGSKLTAAVRGSVVAFEIDDFTAAARTGWSVTVVGHARPVTDPGERAELDELPLETWAPGRRDHFIRISPEMVTGRRVPGTPLPPAVPQ